MRLLSGTVLSRPVKRWMVPCLLALAASVALNSPLTHAQSSNQTTPGNVKKEPFLGLHFATVPEVLYAQLPTLTRGIGIVVEQVKSKSPAAQAGLKRSDILLSYAGKQIKDSEQFAKLVRSDKADHKTTLVVLRHGEKVSLDVALAQACKLAENDSRATSKTGKPPSVAVKATQLQRGKMRVVFEYVPDGQNKTEQKTFKGSLDDIEAKLKELPPSVRDLAKVALDQLRARKNR
jgi:membrane-associated protease RseP (regulator of RpoE activity)